MGKKFLIAKLARLITFVLAGIVGAKSAEMENTSAEVAGYLVSAVMAIVSFYLSTRNDKMLLETEPPKK